MGTQIVHVSSAVRPRDADTSGHVYLCLVGIWQAGSMARWAFCRGLPCETLENLAPLGAQTQGLWPACPTLGSCDREATRLGGNHQRFCGTCFWLCKVKSGVNQWKGVAPALAPGLGHWQCLRRWMLQGR